MSNESRALAPVSPNVFLTFDRLDDDQIVAEMKGAALSEYVYEFQEGGQTVRGLSKTGTDDAARIMAVKYGEALREVDCWLEREDDEAAYFKAKVSRHIIKDDGTSIEMDAAVGHKRQPKQIVLRNGGTKLNPFWYEQGGQKALRNAKQKLMPETIKQAIIKMYVDQGKVRRVRPEDVDAESRRDAAPYTPPKAAGPRQMMPTPGPARPTEATPQEVERVMRQLTVAALPADPEAAAAALIAEIDAIPGLPWSDEVRLRNAQSLARDLNMKGLDNPTRKLLYHALTGAESGKEMTAAQLFVLQVHAGETAALRGIAEWWRERRPTE